MTKNLRVKPKATRTSLENLRISLPPSFEKPTETARETIKPSHPVTPIVSVKDDGRLAKLEILKKSILTCTRCPHLVTSRTQVVYGVGNPFAELLFVGEAPGEEEDLRGEPFIGKAGQLLTKIIGAMEYTRDDIFIANILKCRPDMPAGESGNRKPKPAEMATCLPWLTQQIELIKPKVIVALGLTAVEGLLGEPCTMRDVRGKWLDYQGVPLMPTYHPAYLLRNQTLAEKRKVWEDMLLVLEKLGRPISTKQQGYFLEKA
ncbi:MAG: uracil-DNA glycosylase [Verrucomicrobia bacterium]|nr:uracil-DNA glycosylase [Verrucomicrobiota bacterium]